jgi:AbrB family looped-hinge helix DNA binding protein
MIINKIGKKGQIVIPKEIRDRLHIQSGDNFSFQVQSNSIIIKKIAEDDSTSIVDILKQGKPFPKDLIQNLRNEWG